MSYQPIPGGPLARIIEQLRRDMIAAGLLQEVRKELEEGPCVGIDLAAGHDYTVEVIVRDGVPDFENVVVRKSPTVPDYETPEQRARGR